MQGKNPERRRAERIIFDIKDGLTAVLRNPGDAKIRAHVYILNISESGMQFTTKSSDRSPFKVDEMAVLSELYLNDNKYPNLDIELVIRWILNPPILKYIGIGCEFINVPDSSRNSLDKILSIKNS